MNMDEKLIDLESRYSHQEDLLQQLNDIVASQGQQMDRLETRLQLMFERVKELQSQIPAAGDSGAEEPPPHY